MLYLATSFVKSVIPYYESGKLGLLNTPSSNYSMKRFSNNFVWAADNGCYSKSWNEKSWIAWLERCIPFQESCLWATVPDVVGDHKATVEMFHEYKNVVKDMGYRVCFVGQDGANIDSIPWQEFSCWFTGGTTDWKLHRSIEVHQEAMRRGKRTHMGRVNSLKRFRLAKYRGYNSVDGTFLAFGPDKNLPRLLSWIEDGQQGMDLR